MYLTNLIALPKYMAGPGALSRFPKACSALGKRFALITGEQAGKAALPALSAALANTDFVLTGTWPYGSDCTMAHIAAICEALQSDPPDFLVGMGGGKALDTAKACAHRLGLPVVTLPTIASTCAALSSLSVLYHKDGAFDQFLFFDSPPALCLIDTEIIARAPDKYLRAGMGDTVAKHLECTFSARGDLLDHLSFMGRALSIACYDPVLEKGAEALAQCQAHVPGAALQYVVECIIVSTGLVSLMVQDEYNCAVAHSVCYGLALVPGVEGRFLHGDLVAYGCLVQLVMDGQAGEARRLKAFLSAIGIPTTLAELGAPIDRAALSAMLTETVSGPDMAHIPYPVDEDMIFAAMQQVEALF